MDVNEKNAPRDTGAEGKRKLIFGKGRVAVFLSEVFYGGLFAACGYFLGTATLPYGATPFGVALLCAADRRVFYIYAGLVLSALSSQRRILLIGVYTAILLVRMLTRLVIDPPWRKDNAEQWGERSISEVYPYIFSENIGLRAALSAVGAFAIGVHRLIEGGMLYYDMYGAILSTLAAPAAVLLVSGFFTANAKKYRRLAGFLALSFGVIYALGDTKLYGVSIAAFVCMAVTLLLSRREGAVTGALSGALLGLAVGLPRVPLFALTGLVGGMLFPASTFLALCGALSVAVGWGIYTDGLSVLNGLLSALVSATLLFGMWDKLSASGVVERVGKEPTVNTASDSDRSGRIAYSELCLLAERRRAEETEERARRLSEGLSLVSELLYKMSRTLQSPCYSDLKQICDNAFERACAGCENRTACWQENYRETDRGLLGICSALRRNGSVDKEDVDAPLRDNCQRLPDLLSEINHNAYLHSRQLLENDRTELFAADYEALSELVANVTSEEGEYAQNAELTAELERRLTELGADAEGALVLGRERPEAIIFTEDPNGLLSSVEDLSEVVSDVCGVAVKGPDIDKDGRYIRFSAAPRLSVCFAKRSLRAEGEEEFCGDTLGVFDGRERSYAFISDGMGSGREAAMTSGLCGLFLGRLLSCGGSAEGTLKLLNGFLRNRGGGSIHECSATVDLMELDLYRGKAVFYKSGAAPTYVLRNGNLFKLRSQTVPVGIIKELDFRKIDMELSEGDLVVMVSDGVTDGREECPWLFDLLRCQSAADPERIAELVVKYAKAEGAVDDVSVIVSYLSSKKEK